MFDGKALRAGCILYWTCRRIGLIPNTTSLSNRDWDSPARAAFLHITTGPNWQWSPTNINCKINTCVSHTCKSKNNTYIIVGLEQSNGVICHSQKFLHLHVYCRKQFWNDKGIQSIQRKPLNFSKWKTKSHPKICQSVIQTYR